MTGQTPQPPDMWMPGWATLVRHRPAKHFDDIRWYARCGLICVESPASQDGVIKLCAPCVVCADLDGTSTWD